MAIVAVGFLFLNGLCYLFNCGHGRAYSVGANLGSCDLAIANVFDLLSPHTLCV